MGTHWAKDAELQHVEDIFNRRLVRVLGCRTDKGRTILAFFLRHSEMPLVTELLKQCTGRTEPWLCWLAVMWSTFEEERSRPTLSWHDRCSQVT